MNEQLAKTALQFMGRVQLQGTEVQAFVQVQEALAVIASGQAQPPAVDHQSV